MALKTEPFDAAKYIDTPEDAALFIADAIETGHAGHIAGVLGDIARARGISEIARETGMSRTALYNSLSPAGNPSLDTLLKVAKALQMKLMMVPA
jgi:probable addiction module antidote protein